MPRLIIGAGIALLVLRNTQALLLRWTQSRGVMPLFWNFDKDEIGMLVALDPSRKDPRILFKPRANSWRKLPGRLKDMPSVYDVNQPEFRGQSVAAIIHSDTLWLLKREPHVAGQSAENDPNDFRLLRLGLDGGKPVVIPLRYDVPASVRNPGMGSGTDLERPVINQGSLGATPKGLLFAGAGMGYTNGIHFIQGIPRSGGAASALLYITWNDINMWLARNKPAEIAPTIR